MDETIIRWDTSTAKQVPPLWNHPRPETTPPPLSPPHGGGGVLFRFIALRATFEAVQHHE